MDAIEQALNAKIDEIKGKHWDIERNAPVRKTSPGRWASGLGEILKAYYELEDKQAVLDNISRLESDADRASGDYNRLDNVVSDAESAFERFSSFQVVLQFRANVKRPSYALKGIFLK